MQKYRLFLGIFMALLVANAVLWKDLHDLFLHQHDTAHCEAEGTQTHIHGEEYIPVSCLVCGFQFSTFETLEREFAAINTLSTFIKVQFYQLTLVKVVSIEHRSPRGPPFLLA